MKIANSVLCISLLFLSINSIAQPTPIPNTVAAIQPYTYNVSPSGAFSFALPIDIPPGIKNMAPTLSITYTSQGSSGLLGIGWSISGLSSIARTLPTIYHNRNIDPIDLDANDVLTLDGQRLFIDLTTSLFNTETKNFARIEPHSTWLGGLTHFTVETLDGLIYEYGNSGNSKIYASGATDIVAWAVNKISDRNGNYIEFTYNNYSGESRISSIKYIANSNAGLSPEGEIQFHYSTKFYTYRSFIAGAYLQNTKKLDSITVLHNNNVVNHYGFNYDVNNEDHLKSITNLRTTNGTAEALLPIEINWGKEDLGHTTPPEEIIATNLSNSGGGLSPYFYTLGDFNGDGATDVVKTPSSPLLPFYELYLNDKFDDLDYQTTGSTTFCSGCATYPLSNNLTRTDRKMFFDYNGDGKDDMILVHMGITTFGTATSVEVYISNGTSFATPLPIHFFFVPGPDPSILKIIPGDFDGDGKKELLFMQPINALQVIYDCWLVGDEYPASAVGFLPLPTSTAIAVDFDGDGKDELLRLYESTTSSDCEVYSLTFSYDLLTGNPSCVPFGTFGTFNLLYSAGMPNHSKLYTGDFNGDGKADLLSWTPVLPGFGMQGIWMIHHSDGISFSSALLPSPLDGNLAITGPSLPLTYEYFVNDFNGDGRSDVLQLTSSPPNTDYQMFYSTEFSEFDLVTGTLANVDLSTGTIFEVGDFNADGQADLLAHEVANVPNKFIYFHRDNITDVVTSITHERHRIEVETVPLSRNTAYVPGTALSYPNNSIELPIRVATSLDHKYNNTIVDHNTFVYTNLVLNRRGLGLRGFEKFKTYNSSSSIATETTFDLFNFPSDVPTKIENYNISGTPQLITKTENYYFNTDGGSSGKSRIVAPYRIVSQDFLNNTIKRDSFMYSPSTISTPLYELGVPDSTIQCLGMSDVVKTYYLYDMSLPFYYVKKPQKILKHSIHNNQQIFADSSTFAYYSTTGALREHWSLGGNREIEYYYDMFGNVEKTQVNAVGISTPIVDEFSYTIDGRFIAVSTGMLNSRNDFRYNIWGKITRHATSDGLTTQYSYDAINRLIKTTLPSGAEKHSHYLSTIGDSDAPAFSCLSSTENSNVDLGFEKTFYSYHGKPLKTIYTSFEDTLIVDAEYTFSGLIKKECLPYKHYSSPSEFKQYYYDVFSRLIKTDLTGGATNTIAYNASDPNFLLTTHTNLTTGQNKIVKTDQAGRTIEVTDNTNNVIAYHYNSNGNPDSTTLNNDDKFTTKYTYDQHARAITTTEPNTGTTSVQYDNLDRVTQQTDANGVTYSFQYDDLGRVVQKSGPEGIYATTYHNVYGASDYGKVEEIISPNGTEKGFIYNGLGDIDSETEIIGSQILTTSYKYDAFQRLSDITYPNNYRIRHGYNTIGSLNEIYLLAVNGAPLTRLWELTEKNEKGQSLSVNYHDGLYEVNKGFSTLGLPEQITILNTASTHTIGDFKYSFDATTGNLTQRLDMVNGWQEDFAYDTYDRLTEVQSSNSGTSTILPTFTMEYNDVGNMLKKSDATTSAYNFKYNTYALARVPQPATTNTIPLATQNVTYTPFKRVKTITEGTRGLSFTYGPTSERAKVEYSASGVLDKTRYYAANFERTIDALANQTDLAYVWGGDELVAILAEENGVLKIYYAATDHLGSITHILDDQGTVNDGLLEERNFDAWGRMRDPVSFSYFSTPPAMLCDRGFTGHEHLNDVNIINMNGRLYDPLVGRMFSPDPVFVDPTNSQAYNEYSYCLNNPLKYTDPTGEWVHIVVGAVVGGVVNLGIKAYQGKIDSWGDGFAAFGIGAVAGAAGAATGGVAFAAAGGATGGAGGFVAGAAGGAVGTAVSSPIQSAGNSAYFGDPFMTGRQWLTGIGIGALTGGALNGTIASLNGRSFWNGDLNRVPVTLTYIAPSPTRPLEIPRTPYEKGQEGLRLNNIHQNTEKIASPTNTANYRVPDQITKDQYGVIRQIGEVKHYSIGKTVQYTNQLKDFVIYAHQNQIRFDLYVPNGVNISGSLQNTINQSSFTTITRY